VPLIVWICVATNEDYVLRNGTDITAGGHGRRKTRETRVERKSTVATRSRTVLLSCVRRDDYIALRGRRVVLRTVGPTPVRYVMIRCPSPSNVDGGGSFTVLFVTTIGHATAGRAGIRSVHRGGHVREATAADRERATSRRQRWHFDWSTVGARSELTRFARPLSSSGGRVTIAGPEPT
jgi:hypothetical protein